MIWVYLCILESAVFFFNSASFCLYLIYIQKSLVSQDTDKWYKDVNYISLYKKSKCQNSESKNAYTCSSIGWG